MVAGRAAKAGYLLTALLAWFALALQLRLLTAVLAQDGHTFAFAVWRFLGFFTILTNLAVAVISTAFVVGLSSLASPRVRFAATAALVVVGVVYAVALKSLWNPQGLQALADGQLHEVVPVLFTLTWFASPRGPLGWKDLRWVLIGPAAYLAYALARGRIDGWYAYWFLDPSAQPPAEFALSLALLLASFLAAGAVLMLAHKTLLKRAGRPSRSPSVPPAA